MKILSTKILPKDVIEGFKKHSIDVECKKLIDARENVCDYPDFYQYDSIIITSKRVFQYFDLANLSQTHRFFCVGEASKGVLEHHGFEVLEIANDTDDLIGIIKANYPQRKYLYLCSSLRQDKIFNVLGEESIKIDELIIYKIIELGHKIEVKNYDGFMFFSPSQVRAFAVHNKIRWQPIFTIGKTTADEIKRQFGIEAKYPDEYNFNNLINNVLDYFEKKV